MNRRGFLRFLGVAPVGVAIGAAAAPRHAGEIVVLRHYAIGEGGTEAFVPAVKGNVTPTVVVRAAESRIVQFQKHLSTLKPGSR